MPSNRTRKARKINMPVISETLYRFFNDEINSDTADERGKWELFDVEFHEEKERAAWEICRDEILRHWIKEKPGTRPSAWWRLEAPQKRRRGECESDYLKKHTLLLPGEKIKKK